VVVTPDEVIYALRQPEEPDSHQRRVLDIESFCAIFRKISVETLPLHGLFQIAPVVLFPRDINVIFRFYDLESLAQALLLMETGPQDGMPAYHIHPRPPQRVRHYALDLGTNLDDVHTRTWLFHGVEENPFLKW
jgi:hypothetical protein